MIITTYIIETTVYGIKSWHWKCSCNAKGQGRDTEAQALASAQKHVSKFHANSDIETKSVNPA